MNEWREKEIEEIISFLAQKSALEIEEVFDATLTPREINDMARRFKILKLLEEGKTYADIQMGLGVSTEMISRVSGKIGYGFRRTYGTIEKSKDQPGPKKQHRRSNTRYKGAPSITEILFPKE
jgi:TrpR-related protein YerC/YecD